MVQPVSVTRLRTETSLESKLPNGSTVRGPHGVSATLAFAQSPRWTVMSHRFDARLHTTDVRAFDVTGLAAVIPMSKPVSSRTQIRYSLPPDSMS
ncbi:unannotated protein [freshwater metagenome]|uniref:Unannotated protein n=1 Tax=freshwater metagenome TaxID=449393 RepID=A0A6J7IXJ2_9ZZZZ